MIKRALIVMAISFVMGIIFSFVGEKAWGFDNLGIVVAVLIMGIYVIIAENKKAKAEKEAEETLCEEAISK